MATPRPQAFRGRTGERHALDRLLESVRREQSAALVIRGEPGVGKTALLRYAARQASGFRVAQVVGVESEMELPFAGLHQLCTPMLARVGGLPAPQRAALGVALGLAEGEPPDRFLVALATLGLLSAHAEDRPLLCLVDDAHWLDGASRQVLGFVARRLHAESVAIVFGVRRPSDEHELTGLPELQLGGLEEEDARALLTAALPGRLDERVRDQIVFETRGNPLALLELPRNLSAADLAGGFALPAGRDVRRRLEAHFAGRLDDLPADTRRLALLAAADPVGDAALLWRAADTQGIQRGAADAAADAELLEIGARVRFRHPLVRSAVYGAASPADRRAAHAALERATDAAADPDRRAWHRAHAAAVADEAVAVELIQRAGRAQERGGIAAMAAFLERATALTPDAETRAARALTAARAKFAAADPAGAETLLATAEAGPLGALGLAQVQRLRAEIAFDLQRGRDAPPRLLDAARRLEPLDAELARDTYLEALLAVLYAARLADPGDTERIARAARAMPLPTGASARTVLLAGLATRLVDGYEAAAPTLRAALLACRAAQPQLDWVPVAAMIAAQDQWDADAWRELATSHAELARRTGTLTMLPYALDYLAGLHIHAGQLTIAAGLLTEAEGIAPGHRSETLPFLPLLLAAWRGEERTTLDLVESMTRDALRSGEGCALTAAEHAAAVLFNGLGRYDLAMDAALKASAADEVALSSWALAELVEAASRNGRPEIAEGAAVRLAARAEASGTDWALGTRARALALVEDGPEAEELHEEAIDRLAAAGMGAHLARARLTFGEWLRREGRRVDAREQLRAALQSLTAIGAAGFADRARHELLATGERVRKRRADTRDELTPQELHIARLARDGRTNPEIGAELFISPRTVEWHLRKVFAKLGITSRMGLHEALPSLEDAPAPVGEPV